MEDEVITKVEELLEKLMEQGINQNNIEFIYKLCKIKHLAKEDKEMQGNYGEYGYGRRGYGNYGAGYGEYGYGRRGYDAKYRGYDDIEQMGNSYGRYMDSVGRYGASEESSKHLKSMLECLEDFASVVKEQAQSPEEEQMMKSSFKRIAM